MKELEGYIPVRIGAKKLKSLITPGRDKLICGGLIRKKMRMSTSAKGAMVPAWFKKESKKEGSALEELRAEAGGDLDETSVAPKGQT
jgi:hypothetical protein